MTDIVYNDVDELRGKLYDVIDANLERLNETSSYKEIDAAANTASAALAAKGADITYEKVDEWMEDILDNGGDVSAGIRVKAVEYTMGL